MTISVYLSPKCQAPAEQYEWEGTILDFLESKGITYSLAEVPKSYITVNGLPLSMHDWDKRVIKHSDDVKITGIPFGGIFKGLGSILGGVLGFVFGFLMPSNKGGRDYNAPQQGRKLETASGKANTAKLNDVVPELAGTFIRYVDYLTGPRRYFQNKREQMLEFHACIGPGYYEINPDDVKIADTPFNSMGEDAKFQIFEPNADLSSVATHQNWYTSPEVGGTSSGTAGLELSTELANRENTQPASYLFDGLNISRSSGSFPPGWGSGTLVRVGCSLPYVVSTHNTGGLNPVLASSWTGYFGHLGFSSAESGGIFDGWFPSVVGGGSGDIKTVIFYKSAGEGGTIYLTGEPVGTRNYIFGGLADRQLTNYGDQSITVDGLPFPSNEESMGSSVIFSGGTVYGEWTSEFIVTPSNELTSTIENDFFFSGGLAYINDDGSLSNRTVGIEYQYRDIRGGARTTVRKTYTERTLDQIGFTERLNVPSMRAAVRVRRIGAQATSTQVHDTVYWYGAKCRLNTVTRYPRWTTMSVILRSGGRLAAQSENQINLVATRKLNVLLPDGSWSSDLRPTKDISAWVRYVAHSIGYTDENLDMDELRRLHDLWTSRGETYSYVVELTTVKDAMNSAFGAGMAALTVSDGEIRPVREGVRTQTEKTYAYSQQNMTKPLRRSFRAKRPDDNDGAEVEYFDSETFESKTVICKLPESAGVKLEKVKLNFALTKTQAWRIGMRIARAQKLERWEYSFTTEMDALNSDFGGFVALGDDIIGRGQTAQLRAIQPHAGGALLTVTEKLKWDDSDLFVIGYRNKEGLLEGPFEATRGDTDYQVIANIPKPWPSITLKMDLPHVYFGPADRFMFEALIEDIKPSGTNSVSVKAKNYDARIYADDDNFPED